MIEKMKTALLYDVRDVRIEDTPVRQPEPDQALIKIEASGARPGGRRYMSGGDTP